MVLKLADQANVIAALRIGMQQGMQLGGSRQREHPDPEGQRHAGHGGQAGPFMPLRCVRQIHATAQKPDRSGKGKQISPRHSCCLYRVAPSPSNETEPTVRLKVFEFRAFCKVGGNE